MEINEEKNKSEMREKIKNLEKNMKNLKFTRLSQLELLAKYELRNISANRKLDQTRLDLRQD